MRDSVVKRCSAVDVIESKYAGHPPSTNFRDITSRTKTNGTSVTGWHYFNDINFEG
jgi:hypothetical protein